MMIQSGGDGKDGTRYGAELPRVRRPPLYTVRESPLVQPLCSSSFVQKTCSQFGIATEDLAHEWVALLQALGGRSSGESVPRDCMSLRIPDTVLLSPSGHPSVWYATSSAGRIKPKDLMRVAPGAILDAFRAPLSLSSPPKRPDDVVALYRLGFQVQALTPDQLQTFCSDMEHPSICLLPGACAPHDDSFPATETPPSSGTDPARLTKGVFCLQRHVSEQHSSRFLVLWRHSRRRAHSSSTTAASACRRRAHSDLFLLCRTTSLPVDEGSSEGPAQDDLAMGELQREDNVPPPLSRTADRLVHLDVDKLDDIAESELRRRGFDMNMETPKFLCMKRLASGIADHVNRALSTRQISGLACEFFIGAHNREVYFSALLGIQWHGQPPSWDLLRRVDPISRAMCEHLESLVPVDARVGSDRSFSKTAQTGPSLPLSPSPPRSNPRSPRTVDKRTMHLYEQLNPRFPSVQSPFMQEKQWLYRSPLLPPDVSPRYVSAAVPKSFRDGEFRPLVSAQQTDSVIRLNLSPRAPASLSQVRRSQPRASPRRATQGAINRDTEKDDVDLQTQ